MLNLARQHLAVGGGGGRKRDNSRDGGRSSDNSRKNENGKLSRRSNQQNNSGATITSDADLGCLYYSPGKGQRLIEKTQNRITKHVLNKAHLKHIAEQQYIAEQQAIKAKKLLQIDLSEKLHSYSHTSCC